MLSKYKYTEKERDTLIKSIGIIIDSREKENSHIVKWLESKNIPYIVKGLKQGDYSFYIPKNEELSIPRDLHFDGEIIVERKNSLEELSGNFSENRDRFEKELTFAPKLKYLMIENANYSDICEGNYKTGYNKKAYLGTLHSFMERYNLPVMFMPKTEYSGTYIYYTFYYYLRNLLN